MAKRVWAISAAFGLLSVIASAQTKEDLQRLLDSRGERASSSSVQPMLVSPPMDAPVDPNTYIVGPSDIFVVSFWTTPPLSFTIPVSPEGILLVPTVGEVHVAGGTLSEARNAVTQAIRTKYLSATAGITLVQPREVRVTIEGAVRKPGTHAIFASERVSRAIEIANEATTASKPAISTRPLDVSQLRAEDLEVEKDPTATASSRSVLLVRRSGERRRIDVDLSTVRRSAEGNPYLAEGDRIVVPEIQGPTAMISVAGGIFKPGRFEFVEGDRVRELVDLGRGLRARARADSVVLIRMSGPESHIVLDLRDGTPDWERKLQAGDRLVVPRTGAIGDLAFVQVTGEVRSPGAYPIEPGVTRIREALAMAGGVLPSGSLTAAHIVRSASAQAAVEREKLLSMRGEAFPEERRNLEVENEIRLRYELVSVDFEALLGRGDASQDAVLFGDDLIEIPRTSGNVFVYGQVLRPGHVPFIPKRSAGDYIELAGGLTSDARTGGIMIIKRSSRQWLPPDETTIDDGDAIWVPLNPDQPWTYYLGQMGQIASVLSVTLTLIILLSK